MDTKEATEGVATGKLRKGLRSIAGVVTEAAYAKVEADAKAEGKTISQKLGSIVEEWAHAPAPGPASPRSMEDSSTSPASVEQVSLGAWQEVRGVVQDVLDGDGHLHVLLEDRSWLALVACPPDATGRDHLVAGKRIAILRTDGPEGRFLVRSLDEIS